MKSDLISVIIPTYNRETFILDALNSVYAQSYRPLEVIVVDDGSTDKTAELIRRWISEYSDSDSFIVRLFCQKNMGGNVARNQGIEMSLGKFIAFLDSDDLWSPNKLEKQIALFDDPEIGGVYCGVQEVDAISGQISAAYNRTYPVGWILDQILIRDVTSPTSAFILRKEVFQRVGRFDPQLQARQDWDMWIRLASEYKIQAVPELLVQYRTHSKARTSSDPNKEIRAYEYIRSKYAEMLRLQPLWVKKAAKANFYKRMGRVYFHHRISITKTLQFYLAAILNHPNDFDTWAAAVGLFLPSRVRQCLHHLWNRSFSGTMLEIRSH